MSATIRPLEASEFGAVRAFFAGFSDYERAFFNYGIDSDEVLGDAVAEQRVHVAVDGDRIVGYAALIPGQGGSSHVVDLHLIVAPEVRRGGLGRRMARAMLVQAVRQGFHKVMVRVPVANEPAIVMLQDLGFDAEALLRDHVLSAPGEFGDLVVLTLFTDRAAGNLALAGVEREVGDGPAPTPPASGEGPR